MAYHSQNTKHTEQRKGTLKADRENPQFTFKRKPINIAVDSDWEL